MRGPIDFGSTDGLVGVIFHLQNFRHIYTPQGQNPLDSLPVERVGDHLVFESEGWRITLDTVEIVGPLLNALMATGGYGITRVGKLERVDGGSFTADEACRMLYVLYYFLSFVRGFWIHPILPVGYSNDGQVCWRRWAAQRINSFRYRPSWCDEHHGEALALTFPGFMDRWCDQLWHEPIRLGFHWYIES